MLPISLGCWESSANEHSNEELANATPVLTTGIANVQRLVGQITTNGCIFANKLVETLLTCPHFCVLEIDRVHAICGVMLRRSGFEPYGCRDFCATFSGSKQSTNIRNFEAKVLLKCG